LFQMTLDGLRIASPSSRDALTANREHALLRDRFGRGVASGANWLTFGVWHDLSSCLRAPGPGRLRGASFCLLDDRLDALKGVDLHQ
jgi:hypothetical protein